MDILMPWRRGGCAIAFCIDTSITTAFYYIIFVRVSSFGFMRCFSFFSLCNDMYLAGRSGKRCMKECARVLLFFWGSVGWRVLCLAMWGYDE